MKVNFQCSDENGLNESYEFEIGSSIGADELSKVARDGELLKAITERSGDSICKIIELSKEGNHAEAAKLAREIGFTEEAFEKEGGGLWLAVAVGVAALLYSQSLY